MTLADPEGFYENDPRDPYTRQRWTAEQAAAQGAALLDRLEPGWREMVDPERLDMSDGTYEGKDWCTACVGAQLRYAQLVAAGTDDPTGEYTEFLAMVFPGLYDVGYWPGREFTEHYGFAIPEESDDRLVLWEDLTIAWQRQVRGEVPA
jgi:hypothetical protein